MIGNIVLPVFSNMLV